MRFHGSASLTAIAIGLVTLQNPVAAMAQAGDAPVLVQEGGGAAASIPAETEDLGDDVIMVLGVRLIGQVEAPQPPLLELGEADISAYGASSIAELIQALGPQVTSARGRGGGFPVILVNGVRIGSFRELRSYPPEAIEKFEVFSEEVALRYGYSADQRVINVILKRNYSSSEIEGDYGQPFRGGYSTQDLEATYLRIAGDSRLNVNLGWENSSSLTEAERGVIQSGPVSDVATDPDPAAYRSLVADSAGLEATVNWSTKLGMDHSLSLNSTFEREDSLRLQGLDTVVLTDSSGASVIRTLNADDPLTVDSRTTSYAAAATLNLNLGDWEATTTFDGRSARSNSLIARRADTSALVAAALAGTLDITGPLGSLPDAGEDQARTTTTTANSKTTLRGKPFALPAGDVSLTLDAGFDWNRISSQDTRNPGVRTLLKRGNLNAGINLSLPLTSTDDDVLAAVGDITLNASAGVDHLSDFGTLTDWNLGVTWGLSDALTFNATYVNRDAAPSLAQLGNPEIATLNVPVFDLATNQTVLVTVISGGNPLLPAQRQSDWKLGIQWELPFLDNARLAVDYLRNSSRNVAAAFPVLTPAIEAAFPGRVTRDGTGRLVQIDQRPVSYAAREEERLQFGLNIQGQIGSSTQGNGSAGSRGNTGASGGPVGGPVGGFPGAAAAGSPGGFAGGGQNSGQGGALPGGGSGGPPAGFRPNPEAFARMRAMFCEADAETLRAQFNQAIAAAASGQPVAVGQDGQPINLPPQMLRALSGEDGVIDETEFAAMRERICSASGPGGPGMPGGPGSGFMSGQDTQQGSGAQPGSQGGMQGGFVFGGPPPGGFGAGGPPAGGGGPPAGGFAGGGFGGMARMMGGGGSGGRWFVNLQYNLELRNEVLIAPGVPLLDLLNGDALSSGGQARHGGSLRVGTFYNGFGLIWDATYTGKSTIRGTGLPGSTDLAFGDYVTVNLRAFADLGQRQSLVEAVPFLAGSRIGIDIDNLFGSRQRVTDSAGQVPLRYQPFLIDPVGRSFEIEFRKLF